MLLAALFGAIVGMTLGLFGGGGSTLAIPLLAYGIGLPAKEAVAASLVTVGMAALAGAARHWRSGSLDFPIALTFGLVGAAGAAIGAQLARALTPAVQMTLFALVVLIAAMFMMRPEEAAPDPRPRPTRLPALLIAGLGPGFLTGLVGIGAGFAVVPALIFVAGMPIHRAIGTSLLVIAFNAAGGIASYASYVPMDPAVMVPFAGSAVGAVLLATAWGARIGEARLRTSFAWMLILIGTFTIIWEARSYIEW
jgi:uncharacterized membrane protein YfcA